LGQEKKQEVQGGLAPQAAPFFLIATALHLGYYLFIDGGESGCAHTLTARLYKKI
jgi:hypothetical protein